MRWTPKPLRGLLAGGGGVKLSKDLRTTRKNLLFKTQNAKFRAYIKVNNIVELWELIARESIRDIIARYNANGDSGRIDHMMKLFAEDAVMELSNDQRYHGRQAIRDFFSSIAEQSAQAPERLILRHYTSTLQIDIFDKIRAKGRCYFFVLTEDGLDHWGRYIDEYYCLHNKWLFKNRRVFVDGHSPGSWAEQAERQYE